MRTFLFALTGFAVTLGMWVLQSWWVMLVLGWAHSYDERIPAFGYWATLFLVSALVSIVRLAKACEDMGDAVKR